MKILNLQDRNSIDNKKQYDLIKKLDIICAEINKKNKELNDLKISIEEQKKIILNDFDKFVLNSTNKRKQIEGELIDLQNKLNNLKN